LTLDTVAAGRLPAGRRPRFISLIVLCALAECGVAPGSALGQYQTRPQYRPPPQYQAAPQYRPLPQYLPTPQYQPPRPVPQAPVYEPGPYDNYNHGNGP
jgi:hypothetical protein